MAHAASIWKARTVESCRLKVEKEKQKNIRRTQPDIVKETLHQRLKQFTQKSVGKINKFPLKLCPKYFKNFCLYALKDQTFPNFLVKSVIGFVGGILLTYLCFIFFVFQLSISILHATFMSSIIGVLLTLGLAFSYRVRCLVFLLFPEFFSRVGRYTLTCYALVLILTGPATNTLKNSEVLTESMACAQEQIKESGSNVNGKKSQSLNAISDTLKLMSEDLNNVASKIDKVLKNIKILIKTVTSILNSCYTWLAHKSTYCSKKISSPYAHCVRMVELSALDCQAYFGHKQSDYCRIERLLEEICGHLKKSNFTFNIDYTNKRILSGINRKLSEYSDRVKSMLSVKIHIQHSYTVNTNGSCSGQVPAGIVTEIRNRADPLLTWLSWSSYVTSLFLLLIIFRAKYYQNMFETRSRFDNRYLTQELRNLDLKRFRQRRETVLPLNRREKSKYITMTSFRLIASERIHLSRSIVFMMITTFKLMIHMVADYSLYWVLMVIRNHGRQQTPLQSINPNIGLYVEDSNPIGRILLAMLSAMNFSLLFPAPSPVRCLPDPYPPDLQRYTQIGILIFLLWFFALFEPYGLRLRHVIMGYYRPERAKARALWLYNHILRTRAGFMKFARRRLHREFKYSSESKHTLKSWFNSIIPFPCLRWLLGTDSGTPHCLLCGTIENGRNRMEVLVRCEVAGCPGVYCTSCFQEIGELCTICLSPAHYGDMSDVSLEKGSSEESSDSDDDIRMSSIRTFTKLDSFNDKNVQTNRKDSKQNTSDTKSKKDPRKGNKGSQTRRTDHYEKQILIEITIHQQKYRNKATRIRHNKYFRNSDCTALKSIQYKDRETQICRQCNIKNNRNFIDSQTATSNDNTRKASEIINANNHIQVHNTEELNKRHTSHIEYKLESELQKWITNIDLGVLSKLLLYLINIQKKSSNSYLNLYDHDTRLISKRNKIDINYTQSLQYKECGYKNKKRKNGVTFVSRCETVFNSSPVQEALEPTEKEDVHSEEENKAPDKSHSTDTLSHYIRKFRKLFSCQESVKVKPTIKVVLSCFKSSDSTVDDPSKVNHKSRKKEGEKEGEKEEISERDLNKKKIEDSRQYRLSTYLLDQEWSDRQYEVTVSNIVENGSSEIQITAQNLNEDPNTKVVMETNTLRTTDVEEITVDTDNNNHTENPIREYEPERTLNSIINQQAMSSSDEKLSFDGDTSKNDDTSFPTETNGLTPSLKALLLSKLQRRRH